MTGEENITTQSTMETQQTTVEENTQVDETTSQQQEQVNEDVENSNNEQVEDTTKDVQENTTQVVQEPTTEELKAKLKEYEVKDEEEKLLRESLGLEDVDSQTFNYMTIEDQIVNEGKQRYLRLCTEYGVDANPNNIDASIEELKKNDPAKGYEFLRKFEGLSAEVQNKRNYVQQEVSRYEVGKFNKEYNDLLNASPALNNIIGTYVNSFGNQRNIYEQLHNVMDVVLPAYQEAFEAGKRFAMQDKAKSDKSQIVGGISTQSTPTYTKDTVFTREQLRRMSSEEFSKNEKAIRQAMMEGRIQ